MEMKAEYLVTFNEEAADQLREWEESLLALEKCPREKDPLNNIFRAVHTLKGSAGFIGFDALQKLTHDLESVLSTVRDGARPYDGALGDLLFEGVDMARSMIDAFARGGQQNHDVEEYLARLAEAAGSPGASRSPLVAAKAARETGQRAALRSNQNRRGQECGVAPHGCQPGLQRACGSHGIPRSRGH